VRQLVFLICFLICNIGEAQNVSKYATNNNDGINIRTESSSPDDILLIKQGFNMRVWLGSNATIGLGANQDFNVPDGLGLEYPVGSKIEHLFGGGIWIGAIVDTGTSGNPRRVIAVTTGYGGSSSGYVREMFGHLTDRDTFYTASISDLYSPNRRRVDDDGDGKIDEDELDGYDNDGDGKFDEDYNAVSESDVYIAYVDTFHSPIVLGHIPLGIKVWQRSYAWASRVKEPIVIMEYNIINVGRRRLDSVYLASYADMDVGPANVSGFYERNFSGYLPDVRTAFTHNPTDKPATPLGMTVLGTPKRLDSLRYTFQWHARQNNPSSDAIAYRYMSSGVIKPDESIYPGSDTRF